MTMKPLLLALLLAAPLRAANVDGTRGSSQGPASAPQAQVPAVPSLPASLSAPAAGVPGAASIPGVSLPQAAVPAGAAVSATGPSAAGPSAPKAALSGPEIRPEGAPFGPGPEGESHESAKQGDESAAPKAVPAAGDKSEKAGAAASGSAKSEGGKDAAGSQVSDETAKANADAKFDGASRKSEAAPAVAAPKTLGGRVLAKIGLSRSTGQKVERPKTAFDRDNFGGPQGLTLTKKQKLTYGMRWGLTLTGIATMIQLSLGTLFAFWPWQLHVHKGLLSGFGRVELLTGAGPQTIAQAIATHPLAFFFFQLPMATFKEELVFRALQFGLTFLVIAAVRPAAAAVSKFVEKVPDLFGWETMIQKALGLAGKISSRAFAIAATLSAWSFATAHFAAWGIDPVTIAVHASLGFGLAYIAYKTRSILTAFTAHLTYNLLSVAGVALMIYLSPLAGVAFSLGLSVVSLAGLYLHWRSYRKAKGLAVATAKLAARNGLVAVLMLGLLGSGIVGMAPRGPQQQADYSRPQAAWTIPAQQAAPKQAQPPQQAQPQQGQGQDQQMQGEDQIPPELLEQLRAALGQQGEVSEQHLEGLAAITAQTKQSVVEVINPGVGLGSGYVVSEDGLLLTNAHVANGAQNGVVIIKFENGMGGPAKVVAINTDKDIAIIQLPKRKEGWPALKIARPNSVNEGDEVLAMGHPLGLPFTVTRGIISGVGADRGNLWVDHIQTDAAMNHGNSGGPLINARTGEVVGMNSEIASTNDGNMGLGFSISSKDLQAAVDQYRATGNINSSWLGVIINTTGPQATKQGIMLEQVRPGSPAAKAGLQAGDVLLGANGEVFGQPRAALHQLALSIARTKPGGELVLAVGRDGEVSVIKLQLADKK
jgi:S1-C subfamily serine protease/membrane protease YdiL (CAAX protease family)